MIINSLRLHSKMIVQKCLRRFIRDIEYFSKLSEAVIYTKVSISKILIKKNKQKNKRKHCMKLRSKFNAIII